MLKGLTSNKLKVVAIIAMVVDHIGYYFAFLLSNEIYTILRIIGRISMPIFAFLIIEGYFHTKDLKKYLIRLSCFALLTQLLISLTGILNMIWVPEYITGVTDKLNILFSFVLSLIILYSADKLVLEIKNVFTNKKVNTHIYITILFITIMILSIGVYIYIPIDYGILIPILTILLFLCRKITNSEIIKEEKHKNGTYKILASIIIVAIGILWGELNIFMFLSILFITLYNGKLGKKISTIKYLYYYIFPIQHFILYITALIYYRYYLL